MSLSKTLEFFNSHIWHITLNYKLLVKYLSEKCLQKIDVWKLMVKVINNIFKTESKQKWVVFRLMVFLSNLCDLWLFTIAKSFKWVKDQKCWKVDKTRNVYFYENATYIHIDVRSHVFVNDISVWITLGHCSFTLTEIHLCVVSESIRCYGIFILMWWSTLIRREWYKCDITFKYRVRISHTNI